MLRPKILPYWFVICMNLILEYIEVFLKQIDDSFKKPNYTDSERTSLRVFEH